MVSTHFSDISRPLTHLILSILLRFQSCWTQTVRHFISITETHWGVLLFLPNFCTLCLSLPLSVPCAAHNTTSSSFDWSSLCVSCLAGIYLLSALATSGTIKDPCCYQKFELASTSVCWHSRVPSFSPRLSSAAASRVIKSLSLNAPYFPSPHPSRIPIYFIFQWGAPCSVFFLPFCPSEYLDKAVLLSPHCDVTCFILLLHFFPSFHGQFNHTHENSTVFQLRAETMFLKRYRTLFVQ